MDQSQTPELRIAYDKLADVLYMSIGKPQPGIDEEIDSGVYLRLNEETNKPIGMMIIDFEKRFSKPIDQVIPFNIADFFSQYKQQKAAPQSIVELNKKALRGFEG
ncbi:MAG: DUF2283 domain-containing protein [bacterium]|nr:DUF2283 domain-containing protein [bacterium]